MKTIRRDVLFYPLIALLAQGAVQAADAPPQQQQQVVIEATRTNLAKLAKEVVLAEQRFYQRYNDLNTVRKYAVNCYNEATTSTHFKRMYCQPVYESEAQAEEARQFLVALGAGSSASAGGADNSPGSGPMKAVASGSMNPAGSAGADTSFVAPQAVPGATSKDSFSDIEAGRPGFQKNVVEVTKKSPELQKLLDQHHALVQQYNSIYRKLNDRPSAYDFGSDEKSEQKAAEPAPADAPATGK